MSRIPPASPPFPDAIQAQFAKIMPPGMEPIHLFRVVARDPRLFSRFWGAALLDKGHLTLREREIVILRVCANNRSEYEWGVHVTIFAARASLSAEDVAATCDSDVQNAVWGDKERLLLRLCDELYASTTVTDALWNELAAAYSPEALLELLLLNGYYRMVSVLTNTLQMPLESYAERFPAAARPA